LIIMAPSSVRDEMPSSVIYRHRRFSFHAKFSTKRAAESHADEFRKKTGYPAVIRSFMLKAHGGPRADDAARTYGVYVRRS